VRGGTPTGRPAISLIKAHAYGNDFLIVGEGSLGPDLDRAAFARRVCDRHRGVGADGLMVVRADGRRARMRLLNADGSGSEVSGNGVRCVAAWLAVRGGHSPGETFDIDTDAGTKHLRLAGRDEHQLTFVAEMGPPAELREVDLEVAAASVRAVVLRVGNPQCVVLGPATPERLRTLASALAVHPFFPAGTNVELAEVVTPALVRILIWERGVGPTESSGTGACAAAVAAAAYGGANRSVDVVSPGGRQHVEWTHDGGILLTGWAEVLGEMAWWLA
jgi:diaminopimelate epimerase